MLTADEQITARLAKLDSPQRVKWLREHVSNYIINLAARAYFNLPFCCDGEELDPYQEAYDLSFRLAKLHGFTDAERRIAFTAAWKTGIHHAEKAATLFENAAARHIQLYRRRDDITRSLLRQRQNFPASFPHFTDNDIILISRRFQHRSGTP